MNKLSVLDVQKALSTLRDSHGVDLVHSRGMANMHGKLYPIIGANMTVHDNSRGERATSFEWHIPLENSKTIVGHHTQYGGGGLKPFYNVQIPATYQHHSGMGGKKAWSLGYPMRQHSNRIGPVAVGIDGILEPQASDVLPKELIGKSFHDLALHASKLPSNEGVHVDYHRHPGETPFSEEDLKNFNLRDAIETEVQKNMSMDMPKGQEHNIMISHYRSDNDPLDFYVYNPQTEQLLPSSQSKLINS